MNVNRTDGSCSRSGTIAEYGEAQIAAVHFCHQARLAEGFELRTNFELAHGAVEFSRQARRRLRRIARQVEFRGETGEYAGCFGRASATIAKEDDRIRLEKVEARPVLARPFRPALDFLGQRASVFRRLPPIRIVELEKVREVAELLSI